ncbi:hypothetical protein SMD20_27630 [Nonomuraea sp. LP-02]|uniref:hypothetical protein n=1 Tax=Nonomuraea sp. LP-02 TaxID=3097960 RepID=UPI002E36A942|nr:hypothetical protein [Nonomuraea sp. LP-02]MED7928060.1 hypothetical protein [Nonomuraea sp. LP-02]
MDPASGAYIEVSEEGKGISRRYKQLQSEELGQGFGLALAKHILTQRHPDRCVSIVSADVVLRAGWPKRPSGYPYQPHFFAEVWKPGEPSIVVPVATKGNHSHRGRYSSIQLVSCSAHVEAIHVGPRDQTPCLIFSTELPAEGPVMIYALHAQGKDGWLDSFPKGSLHSLDSIANNENFLPGIQPTIKGDETPASEPGFHVPLRNYAWFQHVLARTVTAGVTAFAGDGDTTAHYLTSRQGSQRYSTGFAHAAIGSVQDAEHKLLDISFTGTDHVFRLNNKRVEAFSGVATNLFSLLSPRVADGKLAPGRVEQYREEVYSRRKSWPEQAWDDKWKGPVSIHEDGTVLAMRLLPG